MLHKTSGRWISTRSTTSFKHRAKKFYLDKNGNLYTKVSHKVSITKVTASKLLSLYIFML